MKTTVLGSSGFIGGHLAAHLRAAGDECWVPGRDDPTILHRNLGTLFYCIGLTANFRTRPYATIDAHISVLRNILEHARFDQLIYLSSTRVYAGCDVASEEQILHALPSRSDDLYNLSKMTGECLALACSTPCRVARLSNVLGAGMGSTNFMGSVVAEAQQTGAVCLNVSPTSVKDYIWIDDAVAGLAAIAKRGTAPVYNVAGGAQVSNETLATLLASRGVAVSFSPHAATIAFPPVNIERLIRDTGFVPAPVLPKLSAWLDGELGHARQP